MHAKPAGFGHRIDQVRKRRPRAATEIVSLGEIGWRDQFDRHALDATRDRGCAEPRGIDQKPAFKARRRVAAGAEFDPVTGRLGMQQWGVKGQRRAGIFGFSTQRQHERVAVDDAGGRRQQGSVAIQRRLHGARLIAGEGFEIVDAIGFGVSLDRGQLCGLFRRRRDDQLAAIAMGNAVLPAILVQRVPAADAHPRHQAAGRIIDAGVDHLRVARRGHGADALGRLQHDHLAARLRQPPGDRQTDHPRTDDDALNSVHFARASGPKIAGCSTPR